MLAQFFDGADHLSGQADLGGFTLVQPEDIADVVTWLLSEESSKVWGANIPVGASPP
jgi:hypothetical protein